VFYAQAIAYNYVKFSLATEGRFTLMPSLGSIPCEYCHKWYIAKTRLFGLHL